MNNKNDYDDHHHHHDIHRIHGFNSSQSQLYVSRPLPCVIIQHPSLNNNANCGNINAMKSCTMDTTTIVVTKEGKNNAYNNASMNQQSNVTKKKSISVIEDFAFDDMISSNSNEALAVSPIINKQEIIDPNHHQYKQQYTYEYQGIRLVDDQHHQHHHHQHHLNPHFQHKRHHIKNNQHTNPKNYMMNSPHNLLLPAHKYYSLNDQHHQHQTITTINAPIFSFPQQFFTSFHPLDIANNYDSQQYYQQHNQHYQQISYDYGDSSASSRVKNHNHTHQDHSKS